VKKTSEAQEVEVGHIEEESVDEGSPSNSQFKLVVSESSGDSDLSLSPVFLQQERNGDKLAQSNLKTIMKKAQIQAPPKKVEPPALSDKTLNPSTHERKKITFLKSLMQNRHLESKGVIDEYYEGGEVVVNMVSKDMMTFIRLQSEAEELRRK
jgi:hypothetical protein